MYIFTIQVLQVFCEKRYCNIMHHSVSNPENATGLLVKGFISETVF